MEEIKTDVLIVGAGPAGLSAAIYTARANWKTVVLKGKAKSRLEMAHKVENYPGFESISGPELLKTFEEQAVNLGAEIITDDVIELGLGFDPKMATTRKRIITAGAVIVCLGKGTAKMEIENEDEYIGMGLSYCAVCDGTFYRDKKVIVYGNDEHALEDALMLQQLGCKVTLISHCKKVKRCPEALRKRAEEKGVNIMVDTKILRVEGESVVQRILVEEIDGERMIDTDALFIIQHVPGSTLLQRAGIEISAEGCVRVDRKQATNLPGVWAAGDITCGGMQIVTGCGEGVMASLEAMRYLRKMKNAKNEA